MDPQETIDRLLAEFGAAEDKQALLRDDSFLTALLMACLRRDLEATR